MKTPPPHPTTPPVIGRKKTAFRNLASAALALVAACLPATAANIVWVSDAPVAGFSGPGSGLTDQGFITLLQNAGHNVIRFNSPDSSATALTPAELVALNTNDLVVIGRAAGSGAFQNPPQATNWNVDIHVPMLSINSYLSRSTRLGWFTGATQPDDTPTTVTALNATDARMDYIFGGVAMNGSTTADFYDETMDRNTSQIVEGPVAGGTRLATATFVPEGGGAAVTATLMAEWPAGTPVRGGLDLLGSYRFYYCAGSRESATAPNGIPLYTSRENLSPTGESLFLRVVQVALNSGVAPVIDPAAPVGFTSQPASGPVLEGSSLTLSVTVTGAAPRTLEWQRDTGDGMTFTNIPDATTTFSMSRYSLSAVTAADQGAKFRVVASNPINTVTSDVVTLAVTLDTAPPTVLSAATLDGSSIIICFDELLDNTPDTSATEDEFSYLVLSEGNGLTVNMAILRPDGRSVELMVTPPAGASFTVNIVNVADRLGHAISAVPGVDVAGMNLGLTSVDVGTVNPAGASAACATNVIQVSGGGLDLQSTADSLRFVHKTVTGDFDARVRVTSLVGTPDHLESTAKAILTARESTANNSPAVNVFLTPLVPADNSVSSNYRATAGAATNNLGSSIRPGGLPNGWMRIRRAGNVFTTFSSANGTDWTEFGSVSLALAPALSVGVGAVSHRNGKLVTATFSDLQITQAPAQPTLSGLSYAGMGLSASFATQSGVTYIVQYKNNIDDALWTNLTTITGDGMVQSFTDPGPANSQRFYRVSIP